MPKYNHILFITNNYELGKKISKNLWEHRKSWCVVSTDNIYDYNVKKFMGTEDYKLLIVTTPDVILQKKVNDFIKFCEKHNVLPIFITKTDNYNEDIVHTMYSNLEEVLEDSFEYIHCDEDVESYKYMIDLLKGYLW